MERMTSSSPLLNRKRQTVTVILSILRGFIAAFSSGLIGFSTAFSTIGRPQLGLTNQETFWFSNLFPICSSIGSLLSVIIIDKFGRRTTLLYGLLPNLIAWTCLYFGSNATVILIGRSLNGISKGIIGVTGQIYGSECLFFKQPYIRESFKIWPGVLIAFCLIIFEPFDLSYRDIASVAFVLTVLELILVYVFLPESPAWLKYQRRYVEMEKSRKALNIPRSALNDQDILNVISDPRQQRESFHEKLKREDVYKPLIATVVLYVLIAFVGGHQVMTHESPNKIYVTSNVRSVGGGALAFRGLLLATNVLLAIIIPFVGFKKIAYTGLTFLSISLVLYAATGVLNATVWHQVTLVMIAFFFDFGVFNMKYILFAYIFPIDAKGLSNVGVGLMNLLATLSLYFHPYLRSILSWWIYVGYAVIDILIVFWIRYYLPEVVGKTQSEIRQFFLKNDG